MKPKFLISTILISGSLWALNNYELGKKLDYRTSSEQNSQNLKSVKKADENSKKLAENTIQVALLLDTSNSMDGLIEQAKSRLWNIVNTLTTLKYEGKSPKIEIALYEYGNDGLSDENWVRKVTPLTQDLDLISEKLFALKTNGGTEYCIESQRGNSSSHSRQNVHQSLRVGNGVEPFAGCNSCN